VAGRLDADLFDLRDARELRAGGEVVLEAFDGFGRAFDVNFDATVGEIADEADDLMARCDALREEAIADALNFSADRVMPRNPHIPSRPTVKNSADQ